MNAALTFIVLLRCCVWSLPRGQAVSFSMVFSGGTQLLVDKATKCDEDDLLHPKNKTTGSAPSVQILSFVSLSQDHGSPHLLVCLLTGLNSPLQDVLWWVDDTEVTSSHIKVSSTSSGGGGAYSATSVWEVSTADWRSGSSYWCGTTQEGRMYKQKLCSGF